MVLFDTNQETLNSLDYTTMGSSGKNYDAYACEYCLKIFNTDFKDLKTLAKKHRDKCKLQLSPLKNGIIKIYEKEQHPAR